MGDRSPYAAPPSRIPFPVSRANQTFVHSLIEGPAADAVVRFLDQADRCPDAWRVLERPLRGEIQVFQQRQIAAAWARVRGGDPERVARRQEFLLRTAISSILFPLEDDGDELLVLLEKRGLPAFFHHSVRALCEHTDDTAAVFAAADACRVAVFQIEDAMREVGDDKHAADTLLASVIEALAHLQAVIADVEVPYGWVGVALLWVTSTYGLGALPDDPTATEHFAEDF